MTATDELRRMLDERGIKWSTSGNSTTRWHAGDTLFRWDVWGGRPRLLMSGVTPAQAVEATLGRGTCRFETVVQYLDKRHSRADMCECDHCGYRCARGFIKDERFKYCPNC